MLAARLNTDLSSLHRTLSEQESKRDRVVGELLRRVGARTVEHLRSYTNEVRPPVGVSPLQAGRGTGRVRPAHPGGWADRKGRLKDGYGFEVARSGDTWTLAIFNNAPHAHLVEAMSGFFVVTGVTDRDGPVFRAFAQAVRELAPEWEVR